MRERICRAATPRARERGQALWLWTQGWPAVQIAGAVGRDAQTLGDWLESFRRQGPDGVTFRQTGGPLRPNGRGPGDAQGGSAAAPACG